MLKLLNTYIRALLGNAKHQFDLAHYLNQSNDPATQDRAFYWLEKAANQGHHQASDTLAHQYIQAGQVDIAIVYLENTLPSQDGLNETLLGQLYLKKYEDYRTLETIQNQPTSSTGIELETDNYAVALLNNAKNQMLAPKKVEEIETYKTKGLTYIQIGVDHGHRLAKHAYAIHLLSEHNNPSKDEIDHAISLIKDAVSQSFEPSMQVLAGIYENGLYGIQTNYKAGLELRIKAASTGSKEGEFVLGVMVYKGNGFKADKMKGLKLIQSAAQRGHQEAKDFLANIS